MEFRGAAVTLAMVLALLTLWMLLHPYRGVAQDGQLYALQALARLHPALAGDLYLQNVSQDRYTIFSPLYAALIGIAGLPAAALALTLLCSAALLGAVWDVARQLTDRATAFFAVALLVVVGGAYGSYHVFNFLEDYLTARSLADAMIVLALACHLRGRRGTALALAAAALFVHPLMALPGLLLLVCLELPLRFCLSGALAGIVAAFGIALAPRFGFAAARLSTVMDPEWLGIVRERSQFLFLPLWTLNDWTVNARPFLSLILSVTALADPRMRRLGIAAMLVGATGLAVASIGGAIGPAALLVQGQAWRWMWVTALVSVLLLAPTVVQLWRDEKCGPLCAILLLSAWSFEVGEILPCILPALALWIARPRITAPLAALLRWAAIGLGAGVLAWVLANAGIALSRMIGQTDRGPLLMQRLASLPELRDFCLLLLWGLWWLLSAPREWWLPASAAVALLAGLAVILPLSFRQSTRVAAATAGDEFTDWRGSIPPDSSVYVAPPTDAGGFVWLTLGRPNYLCVDSSAGVVFSRETALEVRRRSEVLRPVESPDWRILSRLSRRAGDPKEPPPRPLTAASLVRLCADPALGFVVSRERVGFEPLPHRHPGAWQGWNLYDCRRVRAAATAS
jgi:hypothetical protein